MSNFVNAVNASYRRYLLREKKIDIKNYKNSCISPQSLGLYESGLIDFFNKENYNDYPLTDDEIKYLKNNNELKKDWDGPVFIPLNSQKINTKKNICRSKSRSGSRKSRSRSRSRSKINEKIEGKNKNELIKILKDLEKEENKLFTKLNIIKEKKKKLIKFFIKMILVKHPNG